MEADELMLGNYINVDNKIHLPLYSNLIFKIISINKKAVSIELAFKADFDFGQKLKYIKPIPLTEDWLIKFGFEETSKNTFVNEFLIFKISENKFMYEPLNEIIELKYIHTLQNYFFALCGKELILKK